MGIALNRMLIHFSAVKSTITLTQEPFSKAFVVGENDGLSKPVAHPAKASTHPPRYANPANNGLNHNFSPGWGYPLAPTDGW
jgi:hypothetical protein